MPFTLTIETGGAAFADDDGNPYNVAAQAEIARILRALASNLGVVSLLAHDEGKVRDANGNTVGVWSYVAESDDSDRADNLAELLHYYDPAGDWMDTDGSFALVEENTGNEESTGDGSYYLTIHATAGTARHYHLSQDSDEWTPVRLVNLETGEDLPVDLSGWSVAR